MRNTLKHMQICFKNRKWGHSILQRNTWMRPNLLIFGIQCGFYCQINSLPLTMLAKHTEYISNIALVVTVLYFSLSHLYLKIYFFVSHDMLLHCIAWLILLCTGSPVNFLKCILEHALLLFKMYCMTAIFFPLDIYCELLLGFEKSLIKKTVIKNKIWV